MMTALDLESEPALQAYLDQLLEVEFTFRNTGEATQQLLQLSLPDRVFMVDWIGRVASTHLELGFQVARLGSPALPHMGMEIIENWSLHIMETYDRQGLHAAMQAVHSLDTFVEDQHRRENGAVLDESMGILLGFVHGLSGRRLKIGQVGDVPYTDTETLYLPGVQALLPTREANFLLTKVTLAFLWAQIHFGTFRLLYRNDLLEEGQGSLLERYFLLESFRLHGVLKRELPGLYRQLLTMQKYLPTTEMERSLSQFRDRLMQQDVTAETSLTIAREQPAMRYKCLLPVYFGVIMPGAVKECMDQRIHQERLHFRVILNKLLEEREARTLEQHTSTDKSPFKKRQPEKQEGDSGQVEILLDDEPVLLPPEATRLLSSIIVDLGELPDDYLTPAGPGEYDPQLLKEEQEDPDAVWRGTYHEEGASLYDEWDFQRKHYRKDWCAVREKPVRPVYDDFVANTVDKYRGLIKHLRKTFEAMRDEDRLLKRQTQGDGIDIDALVEALADRHLNAEMTDRLFTRMHRTERNIAVIFMVDMSGSTKGWINDAEREALILLCEALEMLGDRYAIYGFSGNTRKRCEIYTIKRFEEHYDTEVKGRITGILPQDYTRMGFAIRHLNKILKSTEAKTRLLITLSDGKPDDYDNYRGVYGIEDTRRALIESRRDGIHPYCITIDEEAREYLPHLYGPAAYTVISEVRELPLKVSDIYRRLTT